MTNRNFLILESTLLIGFVWSLCVLNVPVHAAPETHSHPQLQCVTLEAPEPPPGKATMKSCDDICAAHDAACVWNADNVNPHSCETPTTASCRCCSINEGK